MRCTLGVGEREDAIVRSFRGTVMLWPASWSLASISQRAWAGFSDGAAVHAGVEVGLGASWRAELDADEAAQAVGDGRDAVRKNIGIGNQEHLRGF